MQASTGIWFHLPVDDRLPYTGRYLFIFTIIYDSSICICFSRDVPAIFPNFTNQRRFSGFHLPPAALACNRSGISAASMRRGTSMSAEYRGAGGVHSILSTINSTVFNRCRDSASYLKRTHSRESPYFSTSRLVPGCPGLRIKRVFIWSLRKYSAKNRSFRGCSQCNNGIPKFERRKLFL
jgi:hypothetical protein